PRARPPPNPPRVPTRPQTPHKPRAARSLARGLRAGMDQLPDRPSALHHRRQVMDLVLARSQSSLPQLRPTHSFTTSRRPPHRDRPRPHLHLLGITRRGRQAALVKPGGQSPNGATYLRHSEATLG